MNLAILNDPARLQLGRIRISTHYLPAGKILAVEDRLQTQRLEFDVAKFNFAARIVML